MIAEIAMVQEFPIEGIMRIRINTYREPGEIGYEEHHIQVPVIPLEGYSGKKDKEGNPINQKDYDIWIESLPKVWQNNPCLNQFIQVPLNTPQEKIAEIVLEHAKRVKSAGLDIVSPDIQIGLKNHLQFLGIADKIDVQVRSIRGLDAIVANHEFLGMVKEV